MSAHNWTFRNNWDRATYLLGAYKWAVIASLLGLIVFLMFGLKSIPNPLPGWALPFSVGWSIVFAPSYFVAYGLFRRARGSDKVTVGVADPSEDSTQYRALAIDKNLWKSRQEVGYPPLEDADGLDYVVTKLNHYDDVGQLEVRGVDPDLTPASAWESAERVDEVYSHFHVVKRLYSNLNAKMQGYATKIHDATIVGLLGEQEDAALAPDVDPQGLIDEMEEDIEDLPDAPMPETAPQHARQQGAAETTADSDDLPSEDAADSVRLAPPEGQT